MEKGACKYSVNFLRSIWILCPNVFQSEQYFWEKNVFQVSQTFNRKLHRNTRKIVQLIKRKSDVDADIYGASIFEVNDPIEYDVVNVMGFLGFSDVLKRTNQR